ncbi:MAG TPA: proline dehydrogenase family protein [Trueperaceae bacterium]|nr:proline dehydrogenase family protein [Trueperaceae bacterium]
MLDGAYRRTMLAVADSAAVRGFVTRAGWRLGVGRFVAGESLDGALPKLQALQAAGKRIVLDVLGEYVGDEAAARQAARRIADAIEAAADDGLEPYFSAKPTQLGLAVDAELAFELASELAETASRRGGHLCLDMESSHYVDATLALFERLHASAGAKVSTVLQSYLYRTADDLERLLALSPVPELRIVKGAYNEPREVAYQDKADVDRAYRELVYGALEAGGRVNVATHDERILSEVGAFARGAGLGAERYEFQLLFGVKPVLQDRLVGAGHCLRVYVPFGEDWYGYFSRRLAERPANLAFILRGLTG